MVTISDLQDNFIFEIKGLHKIWTLQSRITIPKNQVINAYQNKDELNNWKGFRVGTYIPFLITAGTYFWKGKRNFWDSMRSKNTIIVQLENHSFDKLYIEVKNPTEAISLLNNK